MTTEKEPILGLTDMPGAEAEAIIRDGLSSYNFAQAGYRDQRRSPSSPVIPIMARSSAV